jgi:hypothetical protein
MQNVKFAKPANHKAVKPFLPNREAHNVESTHMPSPTKTAA